MGGAARPHIIRFLAVPQMVQRRARRAGIPRPTALITDAGGECRPYARGAVIRRRLSHDCCRGRGVRPLLKLSRRPLSLEPAGDEQGIRCLYNELDRDGFLVIVGKTMKDSDAPYSLYEWDGNAGGAMRLFNVVFAKKMKPAGMRSSSLMTEGDFKWSGKTFACHNSGTNFSLSHS